MNSGKGKSIQTVKGSVGAKDLGEGRVNRWSTEDFEGSETALYDTIMISIFVQNHRIYDSKNEP